MPRTYDELVEDFNRGLDEVCQAQKPHRSERRRFRVHFGDSAAYVGKSHTYRTSAQTAAIALSREPANADRTVTVASGHWPGSSGPEATYWRGERVSTGLCRPPK